MPKSVIYKIRQEKPVISIHSQAWMGNVYSRILGYNFVDFIICTENFEYSSVTFFSLTNRKVPVGIC